MRPLIESAPDDELELQIIDGGSDPILAEALSDLLVARNISLLSEPDQGIYDAMNKGVARSDGKFVWFLNGGDQARVREWSRLRSLLTAHEGSLIFCSYEWMTAGRSVVRKPRKASYIRHALPTSHQAIYYPRDRLGPLPYDLSFRVVGDYQLTARLLTEGVPPAQSGEVVAAFGEAGWSASNSRRLIQEAGRVQREVLGIGATRIAASRAHHRMSHLGQKFVGRIAGFAEPKELEGV